MRVVRIAALVAMAALFGLAVVPAHAQSIYGLSFRPTEAAPDGVNRGSADIVDMDGSYYVTVDLNPAYGQLTLDEFPGAEAFVVWSVDMEGESHSVGALDTNLLLEDAEVDHLIAKLYLTAEADADADTPTGDRLFLVELRDVVEAPASAGTGSQRPTTARAGDESIRLVATATRAVATRSTSRATATRAGEASTAGRVAAARATATATKAASAPTAAGAAPSATGRIVGPTATAVTEGKPKDLPTTGEGLGDLLVLGTVGLALVAAGLKLRTVRL